MKLGSSESDSDSLFKTVVNGGYCVGCGACASVQGSPIEMKLDEYEQFKATLVLNRDRAAANVDVQSVCPFSATSLDEDKIGRELFGQTCQYDDKLGYHIATYAGYVCDDGFRSQGSSGGMGSWITAKLLSENLVDGVIHIRQRYPTPEDSRLFKYEISFSVEEILSGAKSRYYPIEMSEMMQTIRDRPGRYAIVGIPCFIKAIRLLTRQDPILADRIKFCIGLVCGHLKSTAFAKLFAWQLGIEPDRLLAIDFRKKLPDADANQYGVEVTGIKDGETVTLDGVARDFYGYDWGLGFFKYKACDYCDDVVAETADLSIGDAWLPQYTKDSQGTNIVIARNPILRDLVEEAMRSGQLKLDRIDREEVVKSQKAGFKHRRDGLAYRLHLADRKGKWRPPKRVRPQADCIDKNEQKRFRLRSEIAEQSHIAFKKAVQSGKFSTFEKKMDDLVQQYRATYQVAKRAKPSKPPLWKRVLRRLKQSLLRILNLRQAFKTPD